MGSVSIETLEEEYPNMTHKQIASAFAKKEGYNIIIRYKHMGASEYTHFGCCNSKSEAAEYLHSDLCDDAKIIYNDGLAKTNKQIRNQMLKEAEKSLGSKQIIKKRRIKKLRKKKLLNKKSSKESNIDYRTKDVHIPIDNVVELEVVFKQKIDEDDQEWLLDSSAEILNYCWPDLISAIVKVNPDVKCSTRIETSEDKAAQSSVKKSNELQSHLVTQPMGVILQKPLGGKQKYDVLLNVYLEAGLSQSTIVIVDPNNLLVPK